MSSHTARQCFEENLANFAHPENDPEKYNLYNGLANLANAISNLENELASLKHDIHNLRRERM
ncbi:MAG: hypothetical protein U9P07_06715 [Pseudomonadota bacterium]|nr:hypothetical protein [Pseudomonadota bacterium]